MLRLRGAKPHQLLCGPAAEELLRGRLSSVLGVSSRRHRNCDRRAIIDGVEQDFSALIAEADVALGRGDGATAKAALERARETSESGEVLGRLADAAYLEHDYFASIDFWERAYAAYRVEGDGVGAVRVARQLGYMHGAFAGNAAAMNGWIARAKALLNESEETSEYGWVAHTQGMFESDRSKRNEFLREAVAVGARFGDRDLEFTAKSYLGASLVHGDQVEEGMLMLDEACAAVSGREVENFHLLEEIFCQMFSACEYAHDVTRADDWIKIGEEIAARRNLPAVSAFCRTHYGGLLTAAGRWDEADLALTEAVRLWGLGKNSLQSGALIRLADLRVRQGRLGEAAQLLEGMDANTEAARPLGALHLALGEHDRAANVIDRALSQMDPVSTTAAHLWALLIDVHLERGAIEDAVNAAERLETAAKKTNNEYIRASAALARGRLCLATGSGDARKCLDEALSGFAKARVPLEVAGTRLELAKAMIDERPEGAIAEAKAAFDAFEKLQAARQADAAAALIRKLGGPARTGAKGSSVLTKREAEVLDLLGYGLSNPEIGDRLYISRKTVEHHVGNVLAKLGLRSRAEAAAYAARSDEKTRS